MPLRVHTSSAGLDASELEPDRDLVLQLDEVHGLDARPGTAAHDHLDGEQRKAVDASAVRSIAAWRRAFDERLTVDGLCLPWLWEVAFIDHGWLRAIRGAAGVAAALDAGGQRAIE